MPVCHTHSINSLFGWLVADGWCWFVLREEYCWLVAGGWFVLREKYCWLVADKPSEQAANQQNHRKKCLVMTKNKDIHLYQLALSTFFPTEFIQEEPMTILQHSISNE
jgi:hypothetical protein